jgi:hypothetical protein
MAACSNCGETLVPGRIYYGRCNPCHGRWIRAGRPVTVPAPQVPTWTAEARARALAVRAEAYEASLRHFAYLMATDMPVKAAARRMRIAVGTAYRYAAVLKNREGAT